MSMSVVSSVLMQLCVFFPWGLTASNKFFFNTMRNVRASIHPKEPWHVLWWTYSQCTGIHHRVADTWVRLVRAELPQNDQKEQQPLISSEVPKETTLKCSSRQNLKWVWVLPFIELFDHVLYSREKYLFYPLIKLSLFYGSLILMEKEWIYSSFVTP